MKTSVLIIAHNEERNIFRCLRSVFMQTRRPDEVIVIAHNCTDNTVAVAQKSNAIVVPYTGPAGIVYARIEGLKHITGDIVLTIDADAYAAVNWVQTMSEQLEHTDTVLVGSWVRFIGGLFLRLSNWLNYFLCVWSKKPQRWVWGASMGFRAIDIPFVQQVFEQSIERSRDLGLTRNPEDYWLGLKMKKRGRVTVTNKTWVAAMVHEDTNKKAIRRTRENMNNGDRMEHYMQMHDEL